MRLNDLKISKYTRPKIVNKVTKKTLQEFFDLYITSHNSIHPAQWFKDAMKWYQIHTFNNPYNIGSPNAELEILLYNKKQISAAIQNRSLIFWGVGKSDTEMEVVNFQLDSDKCSKIIAIDINYKFLKDFANALRDKLKENSQIEIYFLGIRTLFEKVNLAELNIFNGEGKVHICLGNTIGNYENIQDAIRIFVENIEDGDYLMLGFQTNRLIKATINRYCSNKYIESLIISSLPLELRRSLNGEKMSWKYNKEKEQIEAWIGNIQVFRSKKFDPDKLKNIMMNYGFVLKYQFYDNFTTCIHFYEFHKKIHG